MPNLTVAENIELGLGYPKVARTFVQRRALRRKAAEVLERLGADIDPKRKLGTLSIADRRLTVIARGLAAEARLLVLDEPTASLTDEEIAHLHDVIRLLRDQGVAIIYVTHRLQEVFDVTDDVAVMRDGRMVFEAPTASVDRRQLIEHITGTKVITTTGRWRGPAPERGGAPAGRGAHAGRGRRGRELLPPGRGRPRHRGARRRRAHRARADDLRRRPEHRGPRARPREARAAARPPGRDAGRDRAPARGPPAPGHGGDVLGAQEHDPADPARASAPRRCSPSRARGASGRRHTTSSSASGSWCATPRARSGTSRAGTSRRSCSRSGSTRRRRSSSSTSPPTGSTSARRRRSTRSSTSSPRSGKGVDLHLVGVPRARRDVQPRARHARGAARRRVRGRRRHRERARRALLRRLRRQLPSVPGRPTLGARRNPGVKP